MSKVNNTQNEILNGDYKGSKIKKEDLICLRPKSKEGLEPYFLKDILGNKVIINIIE